MEKVKVTQEQAYAIEIMKEKHLEDLEGLFANPDDYDIKGYHKPLFELTPEQCYNALYIGYEVEEKYKEGDWVYVDWVSKDAKQHLFRVKGTEKESGMTFIVIDNPEGNNTPPERIVRHATPEEIAEEKQRRWWAKHGRKPWELRKGDVILNVLSGKLYEVTRQEADGTVRMRFVNISVGRSLTFLKDIYEVVCFVEDRKDLE